MLNISAWAMKRHDPYNYPGGKSRLEPIGILLFAVIMGMAALAIVGEAIERLIEGMYSVSSHGRSLLGNISISVLLSIFMINVAAKLIVIAYCRFVDRKRNVAGICTTLAKEQAFDLCTYGASYLAAILTVINRDLWYLDPCIAILLSCYVSISWLSDARRHIQQLVGCAADKHIIFQLTYLALRHDQRILFIDQVQAVHFGENLMVEVHIGLPPQTPLQESHDIGESLQIKLEGLPFVEIAHVHIDYMYCHSWKEHKMSK
jgi:divalent metal cation (Fe/Co/Zn/Cd) transporter